MSRAYLPPFVKPEDCDRYPARRAVDAATARIDAALQNVHKRELWSDSEVTDLLLDLRSLLTDREETTS